MGAPVRAVAAIAAVALAAWPSGGARDAEGDVAEAAAKGRLRARPGAPERGRALPAGEAALRLGAPRDGIVFVPVRRDPARPAPLVVALHGAGGDAEGAIRMLRPAADALGVILLAPESRGPTWDVILDAFGPDVAYLDRALAKVFAEQAVDPERIAIAGFSDGASYALSLGLANGDLFARVIAFSPGFAAAPAEVGRPRVFVSHGTHDRVLPIERCSRRIVPRLRRDGYEVDYREFDGGHAVPADLARAALEAVAADAPP